MAPERQGQGQGQGQVRGQGHLRVRRPGLRRRPASSLSLGGLRWRLAAWVALVVVISSAISFVVVYSGTGAQLRDQIDRELTGDATELSRVMSTADERSPQRLAGVAARYIGGQPFSATSTVLFAVIPGAATQTNTPELFAHTSIDEGESGTEQAAENRVAGRLLRAPAGYSTVRLLDVGEMRLLKRTVRVHGGRTVTIGVGEPLASVAHAQSGVAKAFILAGALTLLGALIGALLIGTRFSRPLRRMAAVAARVDAGDLEPRISGVDGPGEEVRVLADAFNHMLDRLTEAFAGQRAFIADASHELRTPLTVVRGQLEVLAAQPEPSAEEVQRVQRLVQAEIARVSRLVDELLLLAKAEQTEFLRLQQVDLRGFVSELWDGASLIAQRRFELGEVPAGTLQADPDRLAQALRNLIGNAIAHTAPGDGLVRLTVQRAPQREGQPTTIRFTVQDDGPGIAPDQLERVFDRFHRTDSARDRASGGVGLGLAIVRAIAEAHGGWVAAGRSPQGGARIDLELPGFTPADGSDVAQEPALTGPVSASRSPSRAASGPSPRDRTQAR